MMLGSISAAHHGWSIFWPIVHHRGLFFGCRALRRINTISEKSHDAAMGLNL